jgi:DNA-binding CsgD family transcriptional regulator
MERARRIIQIGREASEIAELVARRQHIARSISGLLGSAVIVLATDDDYIVSGRGRVVAPAINNFDSLSMPMFQAMCDRGSTINPAIASMQAPSRALPVGQSAVMILQELCDERTWRRSSFFQDYMRPAGIDHGLYSAIRVNDSDCDVMGCWRETKDRAFDEEHRAEVDLFVSEFGHLWRRQMRAQPWPGSLPPRYQRAFDLLLTGMSEKQIAAQLELTPASLHQYVKTLYRMLGTSSRAELMARALGRSELA